MLEGDALHKLVFTVLSGHVAQPTKTGSSSVTRGGRIKNNTSSINHQELCIEEVILPRQGALVFISK